MFRDAHCHLTHPLWGQTLTTALDRALSHGIASWVAGGIEPTEWAEQDALAQSYSLTPIFGLHPWWVAEHSDAELEEGFAQMEKVVPRLAGLGEMGLDLHAHANEKSRQFSWFTRQLELAHCHNKPVVLHVVKGHSETLKALATRKHWSGLVHRFSGSVEEAKRYAGLGLTLSIGGPTVLKNAARSQSLWRAIASEKLVIETDAPWDSRFGVALEDQLAKLVEIAEAVASARGETATTVLERSTSNLKRIFGE